MVDERLVILTKETLDRFLTEESPADLIALYSFYHYTAKWQETNQPKCTTDYAANGLKWSEARVRKVKRQLIDMGLVADITLREDGKVTGHYIRLNYILKESTVRELPHLKESTPREIHRVENRDTNALSTNSLNALNTNNKKQGTSKLSKQDFLTMCREKFEDEEVIELLVAWNENRNLAKKPLTKRALEIALNKLEDCAIQSRLSLTSYLEEVIVKGWLTFYPITNKKPTETVEHIEYV